MKTVFLPLDSRPVCFDLPILLNEDLVHPPLEMLDDYRKASSYDSVSSFLEEECRDDDSKGLHDLRRTYLRLFKYSGF